MNRSGRNSKHGLHRRARMPYTRAVLLATVLVVGTATAWAVAVSTAGSDPSPDCPTGVSCADIGGPTPAGDQSLVNGVWQIEGGGSNIWGTSDAFHFAWQDLPADGSIGAQVLSQTDTDQNAKAGVMLRASTAPDSAYYAVFLTPSHGLAVQYRTATGAAALNAGGASLTVPYFVKAVRSGTTFTAMTSSDGQTWTKVSGSSETIPGLSGDLLAGLAVTSHNTGTVSTATFGGVLIDRGTGGTPCTDADGDTCPTQPPPPTTTTTTTTSPTTSTTSTTSTTQPTGPGGNPSPGQVTVCGDALCVDGSPWSMYGSTIYNPGLKPYLSGIKNPAGTVALAQQAHLNTIRITDFLNVKGDPAAAPYDETSWRYVDAMIAAAGAAGLHVDLGLADYRATLWNNCVNPYTAVWEPFIASVANRVNTVTHVVYKDDPTIAFVSVAGEPLPVGTHQFTASATGKPCSITYTTGDLSNFYWSVTSDWAQEGGTVLINSGGLGYLNESTAGIDWKTIFSLPTNAFCDIKTYGGMQAWAPAAASYCRSIGKPVIVEEFGWQQGKGDAQRAQLFDTMVAQLRGLDVAGLAFWNLGYQVGSTSYEINPSTPQTFAAVTQNAP